MKENFGQNVAYEIVCTIYEITKPWTLYLVSVLRYRGLKMENTRKSRFSKILQKNHKADFFSKM